MVIVAPVVAPVAHPCAEAVVVVEQVVDSELGFYLVVALQVPGVGGAQVEQEVGVDGVAFAAGVVGILLAYVFAYQLQLGAAAGGEGSDGGSDK